MEDVEKVELLQEIQRLEAALVADRWLEAYGRLAIICEVIEEELRRQVETSVRD